MAPWLLGAVAVALAASWRVAERDPWVGPVLVLMGLAIGAQAVDGVRMGEIHGRFPNRFPVNADRQGSPVTFWLLVGTYVTCGVLFAGAGLLITAEWLGLLPF
jgi:hypothetical protein